MSSNSRFRRVLRAIFIGPLGPRAGWRLLIFSGVLFVLVWVAGRILERLLGPGEDQAWTPWVTIVDEALALLLTLATVLIMGRLEKRPLSRYGLALARREIPLFLEGGLGGLVAPTLVFLAIWSSGGVSVAGLHISGPELVTYTVGWLLAFLLVSLFEELLFRGYTLFTLATGMGFWAAAALLSAVFGGLHYFLKPQETWADALNVGLLGLFMCLAVRRTGSLSYAIGFHAAFNFAQMFVYGAPNTGNQEGQSVVGHLLETSFHGPELLTGGPMGLQASLFLLPVLALLFHQVHRRHPEVRFPILEAPAASSGSQAQS